MFFSTPKSDEFVVRLRTPVEQQYVALLTDMVNRLGGKLSSIQEAGLAEGELAWEAVFTIADAEQAAEIAESLRQLPGVALLWAEEQTFALHRGGKLEVISKRPLRTTAELSMVYTPGVAKICRRIYAEPQASLTYTIRQNTVAVISDGSAVLGLGNIGPTAALPVMEGKCVLLKTFAGVDAFPICLDTQEIDELVKACVWLAPNFGGINLEDISSPRCVELEERLIAELEIPVFHDDQHGTAVVVLAALENALKIVAKKLNNIRVAVSGAGAAGAAVTKLLLSLGCRQIVVCDRGGILNRRRRLDGNPVKQWLIEHTNPEQIAGSLSDAMRGADVFIGVSGPDLLTVEDIKQMARDAVVFALANPDPEIRPEAAATYARVVATGRSDYPNQINNVLCFPGLFRGLLDIRARRVTEAMKCAAAKAIASVIPESELRPDYIVPNVFNPKVAPAVAAAVKKAAVEQTPV